MNQTIVRNGARNLKIECLGALGGDLGMQNRLEAVLASLGTRKNVPSWPNLVAKLDPRWRQDG